MKRWSRARQVASDCAAALLLAALASGASAADYTGFWKERCDDPYGLQIKPYGEGRYTVTFCGPGNPHCSGPVDAAAATAIEGDNQYEVLADDRLRVVYSDAYQPVYSKCTADPHPLLEYSAADRTAQAQGILLSGMFHLVYLGFAFLGYRFLHARMQPLPPLRRRTYRTFAAALLFSPGMYISWPFASPTFALPALLLQVVALPFVGIALLPAQLAYSLGPVAIAWGLLFLVAQMRASLGRRADSPP